MKHVSFFIYITSSFGQAVGRVPVETSFGTLFGDRPYPTLPRTCEQFLGIPYAKPPIGSLRFADPSPWTDSYPAAGRDATKYGAYCPQITGRGEEDCLFLNVFRPAKTKAGAGLAALVWVHGGAFVAGAGSTLAPGILPATRLTNIYNGCTLSSFHGLIVGSLNYRLGALGFATFEDENGRAGNFGMKDQRQALKWFQSELTAFGGDPTKVTIFGESAGGESMFYHMASPLSKGLFHGAISESGFPAAHDWSYRQELTRSFASKLQCNITATLRECLRSKDVKDPAWTIASIGSISNPLLAADWGPVVDGIDMPETPAKIFYEGRSHAVPFMAGSNSDEANLIVWPLHELGMSESQYKKFVHEIASDYRSHNSAITLNARELEKVFAKYPATVKHKRAMASSLGTDLCFLCATHLTAQSHSSHADMFVYRFNHRSSCQLPELLELPGVYHGSEITYVFGDPEFGACVLTPEETALSLRMQVMWTNFAKHLNPMSPKEAFPKYTNSTRLSMVLQTPADAVEVSYRDDYCDLWQDVVYGKLFHAGSRTYDVMV